MDAQTCKILMGLADVVKLLRESVDEMDSAYRDSTRQAGLLLARVQLDIETISRNWVWPSAAR